LLRKGPNRLLGGDKNDGRSMNISRLLLGAALLSALLYGIASGTGGCDCTVTVDASKVVARYNPLILGSNINWTNDGDGLYDQAKGKVRPDAAGLIKDMGITMLRFPGGSLSEYYDWKKGIGPARLRGMGLDYEKKPQKMDFGLDEFLRLCESLKIVPLFTVGYADNTPETASGIVEYCNGPADSPLGRVRAGNGHPAPYGVTYWEVGNEVYLKGTSREKADEYGRKAAAMARAMKNTDSKVKVGVIGLGVSATWDHAVLGECARDVDFVIYHGYFPYASPDAEETGGAVIASPEKMMREITSLQKTAAEYRPGLPVAVTEYNLDFRDEKGGFVNRPPDTRQALFVAECIRRFELGGVLFAAKWHLSHYASYYFSDINFNKGSRTALSPSYYAQQLYARSGIETIVDAKTASPTVSVLRFGAVRNVRNAPVLTAIAGRDNKGGNLSVIVINRDLQNSYDVRIEVMNFGGIKNVDLTSMRTPESGPADHFITERKALVPEMLRSLRIPAGSISLLRLSS
jgi:alpha-N-arabinofuranosidase